MNRIGLASALALFSASAYAQPGATPPTPPAQTSPSLPANAQTPAPGAPLPAVTDAAIATPAPPTTPAAAAAHPVSFAQAIALAVAHNPDARIAADEVARANALLVETAAALRPLVAAAVAYQQLEGDRSVAGRETSAAESVLAQATISMPLMNFRERADRQRAADQLEVTRANEATVKRSVAITAGKAYLAVFAAERIIEVAELARETAQAHVDFAQQRHTGGLGTELDIARAQAELATDEAQLASAQTARVRAEEALGLLTGQRDALVSTDEPNLERAADPSGIAKRADVLAGIRRLDSAVWSRDQQWAEWVPTLSLNGQGFYTAPQIDPTPRFGLDVLLTLTMPLYDGGYRDGLRQERDAIEAEAREQLDQIDRDASSEARVGLDAVQQARAARAASHKSADLSARALDLANLAYKGGTGTSLEVIDAQRSARDAAAQAVIADDDLRQAELDLLAATGAFP